VIIDNASGWKPGCFLVHAGLPLPGFTCWRCAARCSLIPLAWWAWGKPVTPADALPHLIAVTSGIVCLSRHPLMQCVERDAGNAEIDIGCKSQVELNPTVAHRQPCRLCAEVEEPQVDGFLILWARSPVKRHDRAVRLPGRKIRLSTCPGRAGHCPAVRRVEPRALSAPTCEPSSTG
jgi:hypothetical protein